MAATISVPLSQNMSSLRLSATRRRRLTSTSELHSPSRVCCSGSGRSSELYSPLGAFISLYGSVHFFFFFCLLLLSGLLALIATVLKKLACMHNNAC